jgi:hypothetical protein
MGRLSRNEAMVPAYCKPQLRSSFPEKVCSSPWWFLSTRSLDSGSWGTVNSNCLSTTIRQGLSLEGRDVLKGRGLNPFMSSASNAGLLPSRDR